MERVEAPWATEMTDKNDQRLTDGLRSGDPHAHAQLCRVFGCDIHKFLAQRLGDTDLAEELMLQTLIDATRHILRFSPHNSSFRAWLFGIARSFTT